MGMREILFHDLINRARKDKVHVNIVTSLFHLVPCILAEPLIERLKLSCMMMKYDGDTVLLSLFRDKGFAPKTPALSNMEMDKVDFMSSQHAANP